MLSTNESLPGLSGQRARACAAQAHGFDQPAEESTRLGRQLRAVVEHDARRRGRRSTSIRSTPARRRSSPPSSLNRRTRFLRICRMPAQGRAKPSMKDAAEHDRELAEVHVVLARAAVEHQRAEQHVDQQRIADQLADERAGRNGGRGLVQVVVVDDRGGQLAKLSFSAGKRRCTSLAKQLEVVVEAQRRRRETRSPSPSAAPGQNRPSESAIAAAAGPAGPCGCPWACSSSPRAGRRRSCARPGDSSEFSPPIVVCRSRMHTRWS